MSEQQPVRVQHQASVQRAPVLLEQVVLGISVAGQFLPPRLGSVAACRLMIR